MSEHMNCEYVHNNVDDYSDELLNSLQRQAVDQHIEHCESCAKKIRKRVELVTALKTIPASRASQALKLRIVDARKLKRNKNLVWFSAGFASAMAAAVVMGLLVVMRVSTPLEEDVPTVTAVTNEVSQIQFVVHAQRPLDEVRFSVHVPQGMQLKGYAGLQELAWNGKLLQGDNLLSLPVIAKNPTPGVLVMRVEYRSAGNRTANKEYRVNVNVQERNQLL